MKNIMRVNWVMLVSFIIGSGACLVELRASAPPLNWGLAVASYALFILYTGTRMILVSAGRIPFETFLGGQLVMSNRTIWLANIPIIGGLWLQFPYASDGLLMIYVILSMTATSGFMLCTIVRPPSDRFVWGSPSAISLSNALYFMVYPHPFSYIIAPINLALCAAFLLGKWQLQQIMRDAWEAQREALAARAEAERERDAKTRFLASASHDLGQPLQAARMFFDQAMRSEPGMKRDKAVRGIHWAFDTSAQLLDQMMAHLRLESNAVEAKVETLVIGPVIAELAEMHEPAAGLAHVSLHAMPCGLGVQADPALLRRALGNLVSNAIRHAKARRVLIGGRRSGSRVHIWVIDDGVGIPAADRPRLFEDYVQGSDHGDEIRGGFGLGLSTTQRLARLMGGDAGLEAKWVNGSAFWLELPA